MHLIRLKAKKNNANNFFNYSFRGAAINCTGKKRFLNSVATTQNLMSLNVSERRPSSIYA